MEEENGSNSFKSTQKTAKLTTASTPLWRMEHSPAEFVKLLRLEPNPQFKRQMLQVGVRFIDEFVGRILSPVHE